MAATALMQLPLTCLNEWNYLTWAVKMEMFLKKEGLWTITNAPPVEALTPAQERDNVKALASIILGIEDSQLIHVRRLDSAHECWNVLRRLYVRDSVVSKISLTRKLFRTRMLPGSSVANHLQLMQSMFIELEERDVLFPELHKVFIILSSLSEVFDNLVTSLESLPQQELTLTLITSRLLEEELKQTDNKAARDKPATTSSLNRKAAVQDEEGEFSRINVTKRCFRCGSVSHLQRTCNSQAKDKKDKRRRRSLKSSQVSVIHPMEEKKRKCLKMLE